MTTGPSGSPSIADSRQANAVYRGRSIGKSPHSSPAVIASINKGRPFVTNREAAPELDKLFRNFVDKATGRKKGLEAVAKSA